MTIIGCDYLPGFQQIACIDTETGELTNTRREEPQIYSELGTQGVSARVGLETSGTKGCDAKEGLFEHCQTHSAELLSPEPCAAAIASRRHGTHKPFADLRISCGKTSVNFELTYKKLLRSSSAVSRLARKSSIPPCCCPD
jgi:hypothetical protein